MPGYPQVRYYRPIATYVFLCINVAVFLLMTFSGGSTNPQVQLDFGASYAPLFRQGQYWRLVMPMFLHIGWIHLALNAYALYLLGRFLEPLYGYGRFSFIYVGAGMGGAFLSMTMSNHVSSGASGAIFGIAGAMLVTGFLRHSWIPRHWRRVFGAGILLTILINLVLGVVIPGIDNWAHLGGLVTGMFLCGLIAPARDAEAQMGQPAERGSQALVLAPVAVVLVAMVAAARNYRSTTQINQLLQQSAALLSRHMDNAALDRLQQALRLEPRSARAHAAMGQYEINHKQLQEGIRELETAQRLSPDSAEVALQLSVAYQMAGDPARAEQMLKRAQAVMPPGPDSMEALAELSTNLKLYAQAIQFYQQVIKSQPKASIAENNLAWIYATCEDPKFRDPAGALQHAKRAVQLTDWRQPDFVDTLAEALFANGRFAEAVQTEALALKLDPKNRELLDHMTRYQQAAGQRPI